MKTKEERKQEAREECDKIINKAYKEYDKIVSPALEEYEKKCEEIDNEIEEIIEKNGRKYKLIEEDVK